MARVCTEKVNVLILKRVVGSLIQTLVGVMQDIVLETIQNTTYREEN